MRKIKKIFVIFFLAMAGLCYSSVAVAQSTIYFFVGAIANAECVLKQNGKEIFELRGPLKKTHSAASMDAMYPYNIYSPCSKKGVFKSDGKVLFAVDYVFTNCRNGSKRNLAAEIQLNLTEGSVHYVILKNKGFNDVQFKELSQKEGEKLLKNKKYISLEEYIDK